MPEITTDELFATSPSPIHGEVTTEELMGTSQPEGKGREVSTEELFGQQEEEQKKFKDMSPLMKTLDIISRPSSAIKSVLSNIQTRNIEATKDIPETDIIGRQNAISNLKFQIIDDLKTAYRGLSGKERNSMNELYAKVGVKGVPLLGFLSEVAVDPLMYGGYSAINKVVGKGLEVTGRGAMKIPAVRTVVEETAPVLETLAEGFLTKTKIPKLGEMVDRWLSERHFLKGKEIKYAAQTRLAVRSMARQSGSTPREVGQRVSNIMELRYHPEEMSKVVPNITTEERVLANTLHSHYMNILSEEMKAGIAISPLSNVRSSKIAKLQKNLEVVRNSYAKELAMTRGKLVRELDVYGDKKLKEVTTRLEGRQAGIEDLAHQTHLSNVKKLDKVISDVEMQMNNLERLRLKAIKDEAPKVILDINKQLSKLENQYWYLHSEMADRLQDIPELAKGSVFIKQIDDISQLLAADIEVNLGERGVSLAKQILAAESKMGKLPQTEIGIPKGEARKLLKQLTVERAKREFGYVPRITTDEAKKIIYSMRIGRSKLWSPNLVNAIRRRTEDFTIEEFNEFVRAHGLSSLDGKTIEQFFLTDPSYALAVRGTRSAKAVTSAEFLKGTSIFGLPVAEAPSNYILLPERTLKLSPSLKGMAYPEEVAAEIGRVTEFYMDPTYRPDVWGKFMKHYDSTQDLWKRWQLAVFPKYHLRNMVGNMWNNFLADVNPSYYPKAAAVQAYRKYRHIPFKGDVARQGLKKLGISVDAAEDIIGKGERLGVLEGGWFSSDIDFSVTQALGKGGVTGRGMAVGRTFENNARLAHFMDRLALGKSGEEAALSVKKYLFDYGDVTHFERSVMKRLMPFYTWTRKNIPLQLESLYKTPEKFAPIAIPIRNREPKDLLRLKYSNPNLYQRLPLELQRTIDTVTYIPLEGILPAADLAKIGRPQDILFDLLSPFVKEPLQQSFNKDLYFDRSIQNYPGEKQPFLGADIPVRVRHLLTTISPGARITRELDNLVTKRKKKLPLTPIEWAFASTLSTVYKANLEDLRRRALSKIASDIRELQSAASSAKRNGREEEFQSIMRTVKSTLKEVRGIR